jgi:demethylmenaquinone methyltransferase / 2-methoxy-6-polyprenyl-1,4-benzoquinol methylase
MSVKETQQAMAPGSSQPSFSFGYRKVSAHEKTNLVHQHFDLIAGKYDRMNSLLSLGMHHLWKREAVRMTGAKPGSLVLDACGGTADLALLAAKWQQSQVRGQGSAKGQARFNGQGVKGSRGPLEPSNPDEISEVGPIVVYDMNRAMMEVGRRKAAAGGVLDQVLFVEGDMERLAFNDESFDIVMVAFGIRNLVHPEDGIKETYRVLKKGGCLICLEFYRDVNRWFKPLYDFYSFAIMPLLGNLFAGSRRAYTYLPESIRVFPTSEEFSATLRAIGFSHITHKRLTQGIAVIHRGEKASGGNARDHGAP